MVHWVVRAGLMGGWMETKSGWSFQTWSLLPDFGDAMHVFGDEGEGATGSVETKTMRERRCFKVLSRLIAFLMPWLLHSSSFEGEMACCRVRVLPYGSSHEAFPFVKEVHSLLQRTTR